MDETQSNSNKKQRQRNQKDKKKPQGKQDISPSASPLTGNNVSDPQPQRANRRQRNEAVTPVAANTVCNSTPSASSDNKEATESENVTIDFSKLKRETEEIAKLTKKYAKRNVSSNWHRYSVPECSGDDGKTQEEAPADFSALIQMPASKGGHLQLKDEQEWSSASGEQLGGYFALNLKLLGQGLACVPIYEQLRLPKNMFTEEELKYLDDVASQASRAYNPDKLEDHSTKVLKTLTNLLQREKDVLEEPETKNGISNISNNFNILNVEESTQKLLNIELEPKIIREMSPVGSSNFPNINQVSNEKSLNTTNTEDGNSLVLNVTKLGSNSKLLETSEKSLNLSKDPTDNELPKTEDSDLTEGESSYFSKAKSKNLEEQPVTLSKISTTYSVIDQVDQIVDNSNLSTEVSRGTTTNITKEPPLLNNNFSPDSFNTSEPKSERTKSKPKTPFKNVNESKTTIKENALELEDDDDLDFLLSLKKPSLPEKKKELKPVVNKDTSHTPGSRTSGQTNSTQNNSELDDWLDSVLQG